MFLKLLLERNKHLAVHTADNFYVEQFSHGTHIEAERKLVIRPSVTSKTLMKIKTVEAFLVISADVKEKLKMKKKKV